jgi:hypothetical protein
VECEWPGDEVPVDGLVVLALKVAIEFCRCRTRLLPRRPNDLDVDPRILNRSSLARLSGPPIRRPELPPTPWEVALV